MHTLKFNSKEFPRMLTHMKNNPRKLPYEDKKTAKYGLWLVKDNGIYVMAPSAERDVDNDGVHVIFAQGYDNKQPDIWDKTYAVSRDDFVEFIPLSYAMMDRMEKNGKLTIRIFETELEVRA